LNKPFPRKNLSLRIMANYVESIKWATSLAKGPSEKSEQPSTRNLQRNGQ